MLIPLEKMWCVYSLYSFNFSISNEKFCFLLKKKRKEKKIGVFKKQNFSLVIDKLK